MHFAQLSCKRCLTGAFPSTALAWILRTFTPSRKVPAMQSTPTGRKRRTESEWSSLVARQRESGLSLRDFAKQHSVPLGSLQRWRRRLSSSETADFVDVSPPEMTTTPNWQAEIVLPNGIVLRLRG